MLHRTENRVNGNIANRRISPFLGWRVASSRLDHQLDIKRRLCRIGRQQGKVRIDDLDVWWGFKITGGQNALTLDLRTQPRRFGVEQLDSQILDIKNKGCHILAHVGDDSECVIDPTDAHRCHSRT